MANTTIIEFNNGICDVTVVKLPRDGLHWTMPDMYNVCHDGVDKHGNCSAEDVIRVLGHYLTSAYYKLDSK